VKVSELIKELQKQDPDDEVYYMDGGYDDFEQVGFVYTKQRTIDRARIVVIE